MRALILTTMLLVAACSGTTPSPSMAVAPSPTTAPTFSPTTAPSATAETAQGHITESVTRLMTFSTNEQISAWLDAESAWLDTQSTTVALRPYLVAITRALIDSVYADESTDLRVTALELYQAAQEVPGVELP